MSVLRQHHADRVQMLAQRERSNSAEANDLSSGILPWESRLFWHGTRDSFRLTARLRHARNQSRLLYLQDHLQSNAPPESLPSCKSLVKNGLMVQNEADAV